MSEAKWVKSGQICCIFKIMYHPFQLEVNTATRTSKKVTIAVTFCGSPGYAILRLTVWSRELKSVNCWKTVFDKNGN